MAEKIAGNVTPPLLKPGDAIALLAPARAVERFEMEAFLQWAKNHHLIVKEMPTLYGRHHQFSAEDQKRAFDLETAYLDQEVKAIFCARGGYGSVRLIELIDWQKLPLDSKWLVGYSDITILHLMLGKYRVPSLHGPVALNFGKSNFEESIQSLEKALFQNEISYESDQWEIWNHAPFSGELTGGNLSLIYASLGTPEQLNPEGKVLFLEDLDEYWYHIDRMMVALDRAGIFKDLRGLMMGDFIEMKDNEKKFGEDIKAIVHRICNKYGFPVIWNFEGGHGEKNLSLRMHSSLIFDGRTIKQ